MRDLLPAACDDIRRTGDDRIVRASMCDGDRITRTCTATCQATSVLPTIRRGVAVTVIRTDTNRDLEAAWRWTTSTPPGATGV